MNPRVENEKQYNTTLGWIKRFEKDIKELKQEKEDSNKESGEDLLWLQIRAMESVLEDLEQAADDFLSRFNKRER